MCVSKVVRRVALLAALVFLSGCTAAETQAFNYAVFGGIQESVKDVDGDYGRGTVRHASKKRLRCPHCEGDGVLDGAQCKYCNGKGYTYEFK